MKRKPSLAAINRSLYDDPPQSVEQMIEEAERLERMKRKELIDLKTRERYSRNIRRKKLENYTEEEMNEMTIQCFLDEDASDLVYFFLSKNYTPEQSIEFAYHRVVMVKRRQENGKG